MHAAMQGTEEGVCIRLKGRQNCAKTAPKLRQNCASADDPNTAGQKPAIDHLKAFSQLQMWISRRGRGLLGCRDSKCVVSQQPTTGGGGGSGP